MRVVFIETVKGHLAEIIGYSSALNNNTFQPLSGAGGFFVPNFQFQMKQGRDTFPYITLRCSDSYEYRTQDVRQIWEEEWEKPE